MTSVQEKNVQLTHTKSFQEAFWTLRGDHTDATKKVSGAHRGLAQREGIREGARRITDPLGVPVEGLIGL